MTTWNNSSFDVNSDWSQSDFYEFALSFEGGKVIYKVHGTPEKSEIVYLSNEPGYYALSIYDPNTGEDKLFSEKVTDVYLYSYFALHPSRPIVIYSQDKLGDQQHDLVVYNYSEMKHTTIANQFGSITTFELLNENELILSVNRKGENSIIKVSLDGEITELYSTSHQVLSISASGKHNMVAVSEGRNNAKLVVLGSRSGEVITTISETKESNENRPVFSNDYLIYQTNAFGDALHLVARSLDSWDKVFRVAIPGEIGFFVIDQNYYTWLTPTKLCVVVSKDAKSHPFVLDLVSKEWTLPLSSHTVVGGVAKTSNGLIWSAATCSKTDFVEQHKDGITTTLLEASATNPLVSVEYHTYESHDGTLIQGWLIRNEKPNGKLIVLIHGGPTYVDLDKWNDEVNFYVAAGYHVFRPNYRGSTTFGSAFMLANAGDMGGGDLADIISGAEYATQALQLDTKPIVTGSSYGGYLSLLAIGRFPNLWSGAFANVPIGDVVGWYEQGSAHYKQLIERLIGGPPYGILEKYKERSPISYIEDIAAPVLITAGILDPNAYFPQVENYYNKAVKHQKPVFLKSYQSGHGGRTGTDLLEESIMILEFLNQVSKLE